MKRRTTLLILLGLAVVSCRTKSSPPKPRPEPAKHTRLLDKSLCKRLYSKTTKCGNYLLRAVIQDACNKKIGREVPVENYNRLSTWLDLSCQDLKAAWIKEWKRLERVQKDKKVTPQPNNP